MFLPKQDFVCKILKLCENVDVVFIKFLSCLDAIILK